MFQTLTHIYKYNFKILTVNGLNMFIVK